MGKKQELLDKHKIIFRNGELLIGKNKITFDDYLILDMVNNGANAIILKAQGNVANEVVAIKVWIPDEKPDRNIQSIKEITKLANLNKEKPNTNLVRYYGSGIVNGYYYCIMEYLDMDRYVTLREKHIDRMLLQERYQLLMHIVSGLRYAQENMIFHGDLHADNILVNKTDNTIKIIDFGTSFRNQIYSKKRDNKMTLELGKTLLREEWDRRLIVFYDTSLEQLPQNAIRLLVKATAKILVLLDFWKYGNVETIVEDIALFATLVPFFDLKFLVDCLFQHREVPEHFKQIFKEKIITELYQSARDVEFDELEEMYAEHQRRFIKLCENEPRENYIYRDYQQAVLFNGALYARYFAEDESVIERIEIEQAIE
nr:protein kinase family protein [uncultured Acetatifactor sp.]